MSDYVTAPVGRNVVIGRVVSTYLMDNQYGQTLKMVVEGRAKHGVWLCYVTVPGELRGRYAKHGSGTFEEWLRGKVVRFTATLSSGRKKYVAMGNRPSNAEILGEV